MATGRKQTRCDEPHCWYESLTARFGERAKPRAGQSFRAWKSLRTADSTQQVVCSPARSVIKPAQNSPNLCCRPDRHDGYDNPAVPGRSRFPTLPEISKEIKVPRMSRTTRITKTRRPRGEDILVVIAASLLGVNMADADVVKLKNGGEIRGVVKAAATNPAAPVAELVIETLPGAGDRRRGGRSDVRQHTGLGWSRSTNRKLVTSPTRSTRGGSSPSGAGSTDWSSCVKNNCGGILELNPEHRPARLGLGHKLQSNRWISPEEADAELLAQGYVRYRGRIVTTLERDLLAAGDSRKQEQNDWRPHIRLSAGWLIGQDPGKSGCSGKFPRIRQTPMLFRRLSIFC